MFNKATVFLLASAALASPILGKDPVILINTSDRPWRLLGKGGFDTPLAVTKQGEGGTAARDVYPGYHFPTVAGIRGATPAESRANRDEYKNYFTVDVTIPPGQTMQVEMEGAADLLHTNFYLCDVNDHAPDHKIDAEGRPNPTLVYSVDRSPAQAAAGLPPVKFMPYAHTLPGIRSVLSWDDKNPTVITILKPDWGAVPTIQWAGSYVWSERVESWEAAAKASGADPVAHGIVWRKAQEAALKGEERKAPAEGLKGLERKD